MSEIMNFNAFFYYSGLLILFYLVTILIHEVGHYLVYLNFNGKNKLKVYYGKAKKLFFPITFSLNIDDINHEDKVKVLWAGILTGAVFIYVFAFMFELYYIGLLYFPYILGIRHDFEELWSLKK